MSLVPTFAEPAAEDERACDAQTKNAAAEDPRRRRIRSEAEADHFIMPLSSSPAPTGGFDSTSAAAGMASPASSDVPPWAV